MNKKKLWPPYLWRYLVQQSFQKAHPDAPVMVANAVLILNSWIKETDRGVEWGSGRSTAWLAARCSHLLTVEHDEHWYDKTKAVLENRRLARKVDYRFVPAVGDQMDEPRDHPYAGVADELENASLDFAIVDGQMRLRCAEKVISKLKPGAILVVDGANRYLPNRIGSGYSTIQLAREDPLNAEWAAFLNQVSSWRALHTSDGLWDTRFWVKPN